MQIERALLEKAKEVGESIDPNVPVTFGIAPLPDPVYDVSAGIEAYLLQFNADEGAGA